MTRYYLAARPETLVSIIINGTLPENLKHTANYVNQENLQLFESPHLASAHSNAKNTNTFILEYELQDDTSQFSIEYLPDEESTSITLNRIDLSTLRMIYVYNKTGNSLVTRLLNSKPPVPIQIKPLFYSEENSSVQFERLIGEVATPNKLVTYMKTGDLLASKMQTLINTVNCVGVMGKGIAFAFKHQYPAMFKDYQKLCKTKQVSLGKPYLYIVDENRSIINFPTKNHWKNDSNLDDIERGLQYLAENAKQWGIKSMAIPPLGCGNGGLDWEDVRPLVNKYLAPLKIPLEIYEPFQKKNNEKKRKAPDKGSPQPSLTTFFKSSSSAESEVIGTTKPKRKKTIVENEFSYKYDNKDTMHVYFKDNEIGHLKVEFDSGFYWLDHIEVNNDWKRRGIGTQLIREAIKLIGKLQIPLVSAKDGYEGNYKYRLNEDVEKLVKHCLNLGIINKQINCSQPVPKFSVESLRMV